MVCPPHWGSQIAQTSNRRAALPLLLNSDLVVPPDSMIEKYAKTACRLYLQIDTNYKEIKSLTKQRDELLPLLMNGQVSVNSDLSAH